MRRKLSALILLVAVMATMFSFTSTSFAQESEEKKPLKIGYSDWAGWVAWQIAIEKGWFKDAGVEVEFLWMDYLASMNAYAAGELDAVCMTNGDMLLTGLDRASVAIIINDFSNGNDMLIARKGIDKVADLKGKKIGVEEGLVAHLLALTALEKNGLKPTDVEFVNTPTEKTPVMLETGAVDAIAAWQPNSGEALKGATGSKAVFTSAEVPGLIYDLLCVSKESLSKNKEDWAKVVKVWYKVADYIRDEKNRDDVLKIMSGRVNLTPAEYEPLLKGTYILKLDEALQVWKKGEGLNSVYGSTKFVDAFNVKSGAYETPRNIESYLDPSLTKAYAESKK